MWSDAGDRGSDTSNDFLGLALAEELRLLCWLCDDEFAEFALLLDDLRDLVGFAEELRL